MQFILAVSPLFSVLFRDLNLLPLKELEARAGQKMPRKERLSFGSGTCRVEEVCKYLKPKGM